MVLRKSSRPLVLAVASFVLFAAVGMVAAQHAPTGKPLTIERIASDRDRDKLQPRDPVWLPSGKGVSFIRPLLATAKPVPGAQTSEIWSVDATTGRQQVLISAAELTAAFGNRHVQTSFNGEDEEGADLGQLQSHAWAPDGHAILLAAGDSLAWFDLAAKAPRRLLTTHGELSNPQISPNGRTVSFIQDHTLCLVDVSTGASHAFTQAGTSDRRDGEPDWVYSHELGLQSADWWSPDSSSIAWIETDDQAVDKYSLRKSNGDEDSIAYPKPGSAIPWIRLFVMPVSGGKPVEIDLGSDKNVYIPRVQWLPDGKHLAIERLSRNQKTLDLLLADAATGASRLILTEKDAYWINLGHELHFFKDSRRFLWSSERSGYRHLYLYDISGRQLAQLTQGNWEVTSLAGTDETAGVVYFTATEASQLERQLYRVKLDGSGLTRITKEKGTHQVQSSPAGDIFLDSWSTQAMPPHLDLLHSDGTRVASLSANLIDDLAGYQINRPEFSVMKTHMGAVLNAWMVKPPDFDPARQYPVIVYVAGGPGEQAVREAWGGDIFLWFSFMAQKGYVVFSLDNRGSAGGGHLFEEPLHLRLAAAEMADLRDGVQYLRSLPWIDKTRVGICGWGYGGFLALHGMLDRPVLFKAGFAGSPITDWRLYDAVFAERYLEDPVRNQDGWLSSSPVENAIYLKSPLLLAQATLDEKVHLENSLTLLDELLDKGKYADILLFPDRKDVYEDHGARLIQFQRITDFFLKNL